MLLEIISLLAILFSTACGSSNVPQPDQEKVAAFLENDPYELHNLVDDESHATVKRDLQQQLSELRVALGEAIPLVGIDPDPIQLPEASTRGGVAKSTPQ